jgi:hypothetical protein
MLAEAPAPRRPNAEEKLPAVRRRFDRTELGGTVNSWAAVVTALTVMLTLLTLERLTLPRRFDDEMLMLALLTAAVCVKDVTVELKTVTEKPEPNSGSDRLVQCAK